VAGTLNAVMNLRVPLNVGNFLTSREPVSFSRRTLLHGTSKQSEARKQSKHVLKICWKIRNWLNS